MKIWKQNNKNKMSELTVFFICMCFLFGFLVFIFMKFLLKTRSPVKMIFFFS